MKTYWKCKECQNVGVIYGRFDDQYQLLQWIEGDHADADEDCEFRLTNLTVRLKPWAENVRAEAVTEREMGPYVE